MKVMNKLLRKCLYQLNVINQYIFTLKYMDNENEIVFKTPIEENGLKFYQFPIGYSLFKASKYINPSKPEITLEPNTPYFFGLKNMNDYYIASYEEAYGVIFEFKMLTPYKLLALDDPATLAKLYKSSPVNIQQILKSNFGFQPDLMSPNSNKRLSIDTSDKELARYLCKLGYQGYAIYKMATDFKGSFHPELLICNCQGIQFVKQITSTEKMNKILDDAKLYKISSDMKSDRASNKKQKVNLNLDNDPTFRKGPLFGSDDEMELDGGKLKKVRRNKKTIRINNKTIRQNNKTNRKKNKRNKSNRRKK